MARCLLGATMYIEDVIQKEQVTAEEEKNVKMYLDNVKSFQPIKVSSEQEKERKIEEIEESVREITRFSGFENIEDGALEKLKDLFILQFITIGRQLSTAEKRKKDGLEIPYKSALQWALKLRGIEKVIELKEWYDSTYWSRFYAVKKEVEAREMKSGRP